VKDVSDIIDKAKAQESEKTSSSQAGVLMQCAQDCGCI
jgi:hypothetical protein